MKNFLFIGTYSEPILFGTGEVLQGKGQGIHLYEFNNISGDFTNHGLVAESRNPSFLCVSPDGNNLYSVNELKEYKNEEAGSVSAYTIQEKNGLPCLSFQNRFSSGGTDPCHINLSHKGDFVYTANFMSGSVSVYPTETDGSLQPASQFIQHVGSSIDTRRQAGPHAHSVILTPQGDYALVPDLGIDKLMVYNLDPETGTLTPGENPWFELSPGEGPRACEFHPNKRFCYLINELASSISVLHYDGAGKFEREQVISTLPKGYDGSDNICADLHLTHDGQYLYASNRGHDSLAIFHINQISGMLTLVEIVPCGGKTPRNFTVSSCGQYLLVANQDSDNLVSFLIDFDTGKLEQKSEIYAPTPVCVVPYDN